MIYCRFSLFLWYKKNMIGFPHECVYIYIYTHSIRFLGHPTPPSIFYDMIKRGCWILLVPCFWTKTVDRFQHNVGSTMPLTSSTISKEETVVIFNQLLLGVQKKSSWRPQPQLSRLFLPSVPPSQGCFVNPFLCPKKNWERLIFRQVNALPVAQKPGKPHLFQLLRSRTCTADPKLCDHQCTTCLGASSHSYAQPCHHLVHLPKERGVACSNPLAWPIEGELPL